MSKGSGNKYTYQEAYEYYNNHGCELLSEEYKNTKGKLKYICKCGNMHESSFEVFKRNNRCPKCTPRKTKYTHNGVKKYFEDNKCTLLSTEYKNTKSKLDYICECGNTSTTTFESFKNGHRCRECGRQKADDKLRHKYTDVQEYYKENNCELLEDDYNTVHDKMKFRCHCDNIENAFSFKQFKNYKQCRDCSDINYYDLDRVKKVFETNGCELLATMYKDNHQDVEYICSCGSKESTTIHNYIHSELKRCKKCSMKHIGEKQSFDYEYVFNFFESNNCTLLTKEYINVNQKLKYICSCGNISEIEFNSFQYGHRCRECGIKKTADARRKSYDEVFSIFENNGCLLLEDTYENSKSQTLKHLCKCGKNNEKTLSEFMRNPKCPTCTSEYLSSLRKGKKFPERSGENHPNWRFDLTSEEREKGRFYPEYKTWRSEIYDRDNYTCQCCGDSKGGNLNAHHLDSYDWNTIDRYNLDNGVTLCDICHKDFHGIYGYGENTKEQFEEYMDDILNINKNEELQVT